MKTGTQKKNVREQEIQAMKRGCGIFPHIQIQMNVCKYIYLCVCSMLNLSVININNASNTSVSTRKSRK